MGGTCPLTINDLVKPGRISGIRALQSCPFSLKAAAVRLTTTTGTSELRACRVFVGPGPARCQAMPQCTKQESW